MSPDFNIHGFDEAGRIGDKIIFCDACTKHENELILMLKNLNYFRKLILNKKDVYGFDQGTLLKFVTDLVDDSSIIIRLYYIDQTTQNRLLRGLLYQLSNELFSMRGNFIRLLSTFDRGTVQDCLNHLNRFKRKGIYAESFVKSFAMREMVRKLGRYYVSKFGSRGELDQSSTRIDIQIDGGYPFAFWWKDILEIEEPDFSKGKCLITGVTNGDTYYPLISLAGTVANILHRYPEKQHLYSVNQIHPTELLVDSDEFYNFYKHHAQSLSRPVFQNRLLFIGECAEELQRIMPYIFYLKEGRTKTFEPFIINTNVENFMKDFGYGASERTNILVGNLRSAEDRASLEFCREREYPIYEISEQTEDIESLFADLESITSVAPLSVRTELEARLVRIKTTCLPD